MKLAILAVLLLLISVPYIKAQDDEEEIIEEEEEIIEEEEEEEKPAQPEDPCIGVVCGHGKYCADDRGEGVCRCIQSCRHKGSNGPRFEVCTNQNETLANLCILEREKCMCETGEEGCNITRKNIELKHYGRCRGPLDCPEERLATFAGRIRTWLKHVLRNMAGMGRLSRSEMNMAKETVDPEKADVVAVLWKFCDLDKDPNDAQISQRELLPLFAQLYPLEDCSETFFRQCDSDSNRDISLNEWGSCMGLDEENIKNRCNEIQVDEGTEGGPEPAHLTRP